MKFSSIIWGIFIFTFLGCEHKNNNIATTVIKGNTNCKSFLPARRLSIENGYNTNNVSKSNRSHEGMIKIPGGSFLMGASDEKGAMDEYPQHKVVVNSFWMDATEVTNAQFEKFVKATNYITTAERELNWEEIKKQLPAGTKKPDKSLLSPASLVFAPTAGQVNLNDISQWWKWVKGTSWRHPQGPKSSIKGKENYPVVHVSWDDAVTYAKWAGKRLPSEAEWEYAARGGLIDKKYFWGNEEPERNMPKANIWQGNFPYLNIASDKFIRSAPVKSFLPNNYGLYDMAGNVWEWCSDWYSSEYYKDLKDVANYNPQGPLESYDLMEPTVPKKVLRGGSFLCNISYCRGYRVTSRMKSSPDTTLEHTGFRCVADINEK